MKPIGTKVIIKQDAVKEETEGGILLSVVDQDRPLRGIVVAVGSGRKIVVGDRLRDIALEVVEGDRVIFAKYGGTDMKLEEGDYLLVDEADILAIEA